jgi:hypothetical protein
MCAACLPDTSPTYRGTRTHLSLEKDAPTPRRGHASAEGHVVAFADVGRLHHSVRATRSLTRGVTSCIAAATDTRELRPRAIRHTQPRVTSAIQFPNIASSRRQSTVPQPRPDPFGEGQPGIPHVRLPCIHNIHNSPEFEPLVGYEPLFLLSGPRAEENQGPSTRCSQVIRVSDCTLTWKRTRR